MSAQAHARPEYAQKEGENCNYCHQQPGSKRNFRGIYYATHGRSFADFDNTFEAKLAGVSPDSAGAQAMPTNREYPKRTIAAALDFVMKDIDGRPVNLGRFQGSVVLIVNVASQCGNTPQYASLEKLYEKYRDKGLVVLGFPANDFAAQEPGSNREIKAFCTSQYKVTFPMFSKIVVKGEGKAPLYQYLTSKETSPKFGGEIEWNFAKFVIDRKGEIAGRIAASQDSLAPEIIDSIEALLR